MGSRDMFTVNTVLKINKAIKEARKTAWKSSVGLEMESDPIISG